MIVHMTLDLADKQLEALHVRLTGKKGRATRDQVRNWAGRLVLDALGNHESKTELRNFVCPKCQKPIGLAVPTASPPKLAKVKTAATEAANALELLAKAVKEIA